MILTPRAILTLRQLEGKVLEEPARAIPTPGSVIWAQTIFSIGIYNRKYFLVPKKGPGGRNREGGMKSWVRIVRISIWAKFLPMQSRGVCVNGENRRECGLRAAYTCRARKVLGWPKRCRLAHGFRREHSCKRLKLAQLLGQLGVFLTWSCQSSSSCHSRSGLKVFASSPHSSLLRCRPAVVT
jgi:hypothetical protein